MIEVALFAWLAFWFGRQFYGKRRERWLTFGRGWKPVGVVVWQDAQATWNQIRMWVVRKRLTEAQVIEVIDALEQELRDDGRYREF